jgi:bacteriophage exclusion system BrxB-like protein
MDWDSPKFERFLDAAIRMARGELPGYGYPYVVLPYPPREEKRCIEEMLGARRRLGDAGLESNVCAVSPYIARAAARYAERELPEADDYARLLSDLSDPRGGLVSKAAALCAREINESVASGAVVLLCRLGALYPFGHVSTLLEGLYGAGVRNTVAVAYPGTADGTELRFLGLVDPTGGYRGHVVT